jgi:hypothetical protein
VTGNRPIEATIIADRPWALRRPEQQRFGVQTIFYRRDNLIPQDKDLASGDVFACHFVIVMPGPWIPGVGVALHRIVRYSLN